MNWAIEKKFNQNYETYKAILTYQEKMLFSALETFMSEGDYKKYLSQMDREELYAKSLPLFQTLNKDFGFTHFYYMKPNLGIFLRVHNKDKYGDICNRITCNKAKDASGTVAGIEFGPLMYFTLRVVKPYYQDNNLIGYVEFGKEIDEIGDEFKKITGDEISLLIDKKNINKTLWGDAMKSRGVKDNWDKLEGYVVVGTSHKTEELYNEKHAKNCFDSEKLKKVEDNGVLIGKFEHETGHVVCSAFPLYDASNKKVGVIVFHDDVSEIISVNEKAIRNIKIAIAGLLIFSLIVIILVFIFAKKSIINPLKKLTSAAEDISSGDISVKIPAGLKKSKNEIGEMANAFSKLIESSQTALKTFVESKFKKNKKGDKK